MTRWNAATRRCGWSRAGGTNETICLFGCWFAIHLWYNGLLLNRNRCWMCRELGWLNWLQRLDDRAHFFGYILDHRVGSTHSHRKRFLGSCDCKVEHGLRSASRLDWSDSAWSWFGSSRWLGSGWYRFRDRDSTRSNLGRARYRARLAAWTRRWTRHCECVGCLIERQLSLSSWQILSWGQRAARRSNINWLDPWFGHCRLLEWRGRADIRHRFSNRLWARYSSRSRLRRGLNVVLNELVLYQVITRSLPSRTVHWWPIGFQDAPSPVE